MQIKDLIRQIEKYPDAHVVIQGEICHGVKVSRGRIELGYYNPHFVVDNHGTEKAVTFLQNMELSTGEVVSASV